MSCITQYLILKHDTINDKGLNQIFRGSKILIAENLLLIFMFILFGVMPSPGERTLEMNPFITYKAQLLSLFIVLICVDIIGMLYLGLGFLNSEKIKERNNGRIKSIFYIHIVWIGTIIVNRIVLFHYLSIFEFHRNLSDLTGEDIFLSSVIAFTWAIAQFCLTLSNFLITKTMKDLYGVYLYFYAGCFLANLICSIFLSFITMSVIYETFLVILTDSSTAYESYFTDLWSVMDLIAVTKLITVPILTILMLRQLRMDLTDWEQKTKKPKKSRYFAIDRQEKSSQHV